MHKILLNDSEMDPKLDLLPCLIHGKAHEGASLFTVTLIANLYKEGSKLLFLSGYPMAREELLKQVGNTDGAVLGSKNMSIEELENTKIIFIQREDSNKFIQLAKSLPDISERVVLIKNIDLFNKEVYLSAKNHDKLVLSGDLDSCSFSDDIQEKEFNCMILFSTPQTKLGIDLPSLSKYEGYLSSKEGANGIVKVTP